MAITYTPARQRSFVAAHGRAGEGTASMDIDYEPPRKRTHYEANTEMDWEPHPVPRPSALLSKNDNNTTGGTGGLSNANAHSRAFLAAASSTSPFLFHTSAMQLDEPAPAVQAPVASTSASTLPDHVDEDSKATPSQPATAPSRDIANGAVQRERRKRDQLKGWQIAKGKGVQVDDDIDEKDEGESADEVETSFMESLNLSAPIKGLLRRDRSSRRRGEHAPVHFSLHNHNYNWPLNSQEPFQFGSLTPSATAKYPDHSAPQSLAGWWHSDMPYVLLGYLQFGFNTSLILVSLYLLLSFLMLLKHDVAERVSEYSIELQQEIMQCSSQYISNRCQPGERVPAMESMCQKWEFCMNKDPKVVNKLRVAAEIVAEVVNGFVEVISWRTMLFLLATLFIIVAYTNRTITTYRANYTHDPSEKLYPAPSDQQSFTSKTRSSSDKDMMQAIPR